MSNIIVTRHKGLVEWLRRRGIEGEVISHITDPEIIRGRVVYGALPLHLAAEAYLAAAVDMPNLPPEKRGQDLTPEEMDAYGATLTYYSVRRMVPADDDFSELLENIGRAALGAFTSEPWTKERKRAIVRLLKADLADLEAMAEE